jgi:hypothetical protein
MQEVVTVWRLVVEHFKSWKSSDIWEQPYRIRIPFRKKLRADRSQAMLLSFGAEFLSSALLLKNIQIKITEL